MVPEELIRQRLSGLRGLMHAGKADVMLLTSPQSVRYFSGFTGEDSYLLVWSRRAMLITDGRYAEQAERDCPWLKAFVRTGGLVKAMGECLGAGRLWLGVEANHVTLALHAALAKGLPKAKLIPVGGAIAALRECKDADELKEIRRAVAVAEDSFKFMLRGGLKKFVGRTERQVAAELDYQMHSRGAQGPAFESIVAAGAHGSVVHYRPGETKIKAGDPVLIDWGARVAGYCSDLTRVVFTGRIPLATGRLYEIVRKAQKAGIAAIGPKVSCGAVDAAGRQVVESAGFGEAFCHGLGHGVGLEIHEAPRVVKGAKQELKAGMVVTVEPGIYLPGVGGVRIEDDVLVTPQGRRRLSSLSRELSAMVLR